MTEFPIRQRVGQYAKLRAGNNSVESTLSQRLAKVVPRWRRSYVSCCPNSATELQGGVHLFCRTRKNLQTAQKNVLSRIWRGARGGENGRNCTKREIFPFANRY